jgi:hypothetical protein
MRRLPQIFLVLIVFASEGEWLLLLGRGLKLLFVQLYFQ